MAPGHTVNPCLHPRSDAVLREMEVPMKDAEGQHEEAVNFSSRARFKAKQLQNVPSTCSVYRSAVRL
jgi:hypothetical protein